MSTQTTGHTGRAVLSGLTAAGTGQATALPLIRSGDHQFTTVGSSTGAILPPASPPNSISVWNGGAHSLSIYPPSGGKVNDGSADAAYSLSTATGIELFTVDGFNWYTKGVTSAGSGITGLTGDVTTAAGSSGSTAAFLAGQSTVAAVSVSSSQNDWSPSGWLSTGAMAANIIRATITASGVNVTGLVPPSAGTIEGVIVTLENAVASTNPLRLKASSSSSSAANRFSFKSDIFLDPGESVALQYDNTATVWRELAPHKSYDTQFWGSAKDGTGPTTTASLTRTMYYDDWTIPASQVFTLNGCDIFVNGTLDISNASTGSIVMNGGAGTAGAAGGTAGAAGTTLNGTVITFLVPDVGKIGGAGSVNNGGAGTAFAARTVYNATISAIGGAGGAGGTGTAGTLGGALSPTQAPLSYQWPGNVILGGAAYTPVYASVGGGSGGGGGGDTTNSGGGGGGSGTGGGGIRIFARKIYRGTNANTGIIQAKGGAGGNGGSPSAGNTGGGGGGGGGQGGTVFIYHSGLFGTQITGAIDVTGGTGGTGGAPHGSATAGSGGYAGPGGYVMLMDLRTGTATDFVGGARVANSTTTGGTATTAQTAL